MKKILFAFIGAVLLLSVVSVWAGADQTFTSLDDAADYCREQAIGRASQLDYTLIVSMDDVEASGDLYDYYYYAQDYIRNKMLAHTGAGTEGDYLFWTVGETSGSASISVSGSQVSYNMHSTIGYYTTYAQESDLTSALQQIYRQLKLSEKSDYGKVIAITDWICDNVTYDYANLDNDGYNLKYTAYAAAINGTSVCQGYATLFYRMALDNDIDARVVTGTADGGDHAWNIVRLDGVYYLVDVTWADGTGRKDKYILCGTEDFGLDAGSHIADWPPELYTDYTISATAYPYSRAGGQMPEITSQPSDVMAQNGKKAEFSVGAAGAESYQWQASSDNGTTWKDSGAAGAKTPVLSVNVGTGTVKALYRCAVSNANGTVYSSSVRISLDDAKPIITAHPKNVSVKTGARASFGVSSLNASAYQWQASSDNGKTWKASGASSAKTATLNVNGTEATARALYRCMLTNANGTSYSGSVSLTLTDSKPIIRVQPANVSLKTGQAAVFTVNAVGASAYQWQASSDNGKTWKNSGASGAKSATLSVNATTATAKVLYRCRLTNNYGVTYSDSVSLKITDAKPIIKTQPSGKTAQAGQKVSFTVSAIGAASYQWQASPDGGKTWKNSGASGAKSATLSVNATTATAKVLYRCVLTNANGTTYSDSVRITMTAA
ncbi:MAG: hypothetical protein K6G90_14785 [Clostridia bacterium]|nr:hypothetical protein [Clostridia bacterium]